MSESPCLGCEGVETRPVTLRSGVVVCSSCEAWRHECEVRDLAHMPGAQRVEQLQGIEKQRGAAAAKRLADDIRALRTHQQQRRASDANGRT